MAVAVVRRGSAALGAECQRLLASGSRQVVAQAVACEVALAVVDSQGVALVGTTCRRLPATSQVRHSRRTSVTSPRSPRPQRYQWGLD
jgi:hypothetical protein